MCPAVPERRCGGHAGKAERRPPAFQQRYFGVSRTFRSVRSAQQQPRVMLSAGRWRIAPRLCYTGAARQMVLLIAPAIPQLIQMNTLPEPAEQGRSARAGPREQSCFFDRAATARPALADRRQALVDRAASRAGSGAHGTGRTGNIFLYKSATRLITRMMQTDSHKACIPSNFNSGSLAKGGHAAKHGFGFLCDASGVGGNARCAAHSRLEAGIAFPML